MNIEHIPVQGYPGQQEQQQCEECGGLLEIKDMIWDHGTKARVSMWCVACGNIQVSTKEWRMFRYRITVRGTA